MHTQQAQNMRHYTMGANNVTIKTMIAHETNYIHTDAHMLTAIHCRRFRRKIPLTHGGGIARVKRRNGRSARPERGDNSKARRAILLPTMVTTAPPDTNEYQLPMIAGAPPHKKEFTYKSPMNHLYYFAKRVPRTRGAAQARISPRSWHTISRPARDTNARHAGLKKKRIMGNVALG